MLVIAPSKYRVPRYTVLKGSIDLATLIGLELRVFAYFSYFIYLFIFFPYYNTPESLLFVCILYYAITCNKYSNLFINYLYLKALGDTLVSYHSKLHPLENGSHQIPSKGSQEFGCHVILASDSWCQVTHSHQPCHVIRSPSDLQSSLTSRFMCQVYSREFLIHDPGLLYDPLSLHSKYVYKYSVFSTNNHPLFT